MSGSVILSFHETLLHQSDVDLLTGPHWLNDTIISFYFEYLEKVKFASSTDFLFISPEVTQCIKMVSPDEIGIFLTPLKTKERKFVFFALNDNDAPDTIGGSHWSLLVYSYPENTFFHLDSLSGNNKYIAKKFSKHLATYFNITGPPNFMSKACKQQKNSYDCGVYVAINTELIAEHAQQNNMVASCDTNIYISCSEKRKQILAVIHSLASSSNVI